MKGGSGFVEAFSARGPNDTKGRSLRQLDLRTRLFRYPCSYLMYAPQFERLPADAKAAVYSRLWAILSGRVTGTQYRQLSAVDRRAVINPARQAGPRRFAASAASRCAGGTGRLEFDRSRIDRASTADYGDESEAREELFGRRREQIVAGTPRRVFDRGLREAAPSPFPAPFDGRPATQERAPDISNATAPTMARAPRRRSRRSASRALERETGVAKKRLDALCRLRRA